MRVRVRLRVRVHTYTDIHTYICNTLIYEARDGAAVFEGVGMRFRTAAVIANIELEFSTFTDITGLVRQGCVSPYRRPKVE